MILEEHTNEEILFDRLVDGELSGAQRRRLLESLDVRPEGWRRCALAFLEAQSWSEGLGELLREPESAAVAEQRHALATSTRVIPVRNNKRRRAAWLAIAAGLLMAFTLGLIWRSESPVTDGVRQPVGQIAEVIPPPRSTGPISAGRADALTLWVRDESGNTRPLRVPLMDAGTLDQQLGLQFQSGVPAELRRGLQDRGFDVESKRRYAPLWLENGRPMIVPVEDTRIVPVNQSVY